MVQGRETDNAEFEAKMKDVSTKTLCAGIAGCAVCIIVQFITAIFLFIGAIIIASNPICDALYFGTGEPNTVILPDLRNLSLSERHSLLEGSYELSSEYYLKMEIDSVQIISLCILKRYFSKVSACVAIGTNVEQVVICGPDMRPDCLPSAVVEHYIGLSLWHRERSTVLYTIMDIDTSARAGKYLTNTTITLSAVWYEVLGYCQTVVNLTLTVIVFGALSFIGCLGCIGCWLRGCCLCCKEKRVSSTESVHTAVSEIGHRNRLVPINHQWPMKGYFMMSTDHDESTSDTPDMDINEAPLDLLRQKPNMLKDLNNKVVARVAGKWETTGLELNIEDYVLQAIKAPYGSNEYHCREMFRRWLAKEEGCGTLPRTWSSVLHAVENSCGSEVSRDIREIV